jgi:hypothetical protein
MAPIPTSYSTRASHDIALCHLLWPCMYISNNTACIVYDPHDNKTCIVQTTHVRPINSNVVWALLWRSRPPHGMHVHDI